MSSLIFPSLAVHPISLHISLHSILDSIQPISLHIIHPISLHIILRRPNRRFTVRLCLPKTKQSIFPSLSFPPLRLLSVSLEILLLTFPVSESSLDGQSIHYTSTFLSSMFEGVAGQHQADNPAEGERESQGEDEAEDADQDDQFEGQGYQCHEEQGSSQTLRTPPLAVSKGQRVTKEPDRLTYSIFRAKKPKKK
ncbi:OLC1v1013502C1 [Oldenlandia corymbosa var. corymbosa]|uniref:OLC1v1013502C1 n=1 Tax=Oldenlandia corymbosa var. corymbosa TaxID=529605 RepID=A0AAV1DYE7_OLDCO|nr:OLC1v1013502C1 [Oldenlandia corymbosa var. corymbosa]